MSSRRRAEIHTGDHIRTVLLIEKGGWGHFLRSFFIIAIFLVLLMLSYFFGVYAGTNGNHTRTFKNLAHNNALGVENIWAKFLDLDKHKDIHIGTTATALNSKIDKVRTELLGTCGLISHKMNESMKNTKKAMEDSKATADNLGLILGEACKNVN